MTAAEFLKLTDREKDALVAEHVMGWKKHPGMPPQSQTKEENDIPHYTTDISDAWQVVDRMIEYMFDVQTTEKFKAVQIERLEVTRWEIVVESTEANTVPLAICLSALKAKGVIHD